MTCKNLFAGLLALLMLIGVPAHAQENPQGMPSLGTPTQQKEAPQPAPAVKPSLQDFFEFLAQMAQPAGPQQLTPAELEELYHDVWERIGMTYHDAQALKTWGTWEHKYDGQLQKPEDLERALKEMCASLNDRWTEYVTSAEIAQARADAKAGLVTLGMQLKREADGSYRIDYLMYGSPAHKSDLRKGDLVKSISGKDLKGMAQSDVDKLLKGKAGTKVALVYSDNGKDVKIDLTLAVTPDATVDYKLLPGNIAYVRLPDFSSELVIAEFLAAIDDMNTQAKGKIEGIVFDLRGNPGGQFQLAILVSSLFLEKGTIVTGTTRTGRMITHQTYEVIPYLPHMLAGAPADMDKLALILQSKPLTVLTDGSTASAAEIVTGALKDNGRATVIGGTTYGKGVGYNRFQLPTGGVLLVTTLDYLTPSGFNLSNKGIAPNKVVDQPRGSQVDEQLNSGVKAIKDQLASPTQPSGKQTMTGNDTTSHLRHVLRLTILLLLLLLVINMRRSRFRR